MLKRHLSLTALATAALALGTTAAPVAFYTDSGFGAFDTPNANSWGASNKTTTSAIFEVFIDFTQAADDATDPITLFELGADAIGSGITIDGDDILFAAGGGSVANTGTVSGAHGLTAGDTNVQVVAVIQYGAGTLTNELLSLYVNGVQVGSTADVQAGTDWAGANTSNLGSSDSFQIFEYVPSLNATPDDGSNGQYSGNYPTDGATIEFAAYELGVGDNTVANILVPEPTSLALLGLGGLCVMRRRRG
jgi:hypothetical protein